MTVVGFLAVQLIAFAPLFAFDKYDILVNDDNSSTDQLSPRVAAGISGNFLVVWVDKRNGQNDIYGQFYDTSGQAIGANIRVNDDDAAVPQFEPAVAGNKFGQFASVWKDYRNGSYPFQPDIYFSRVDTSQSFGDLNVTSEPPDSTKESPDISLFPDGSSIVVWSDYRNHNWDIYGQKLNVNGGLTGKNFKVNSDAGANQQHSPRVAAFSDGGFVIVWYDNRNGNDDIFGQIYNSLGNPVGANIKLNDDIGNGRQAFPAVAADGSKRISVAWVDWRNGVYPQNPDIYFRRFDSTGTPLIASIRINLNGGNYPQREVSICSDWLGNLALVWADSSNGQWDAMSQIIDHSGTFVGTNFRIHQNQAGRQLQPDVDADGYKLFFAWADSRSGNFDIYATVYQYNQPKLFSTPNSLNFTMELAGSLPPPQQIVVANAGIGTLPWSASPTAAWLSVAPSEGTTPDTLIVSVTNSSMPYGDSFAGIRLINSETQDSSVVVPVKLTVSAPLLSVTPDSLYFKVFATLGNPSSRSFQISNIGTGSLSWTTTENASWFAVDKSSGNAPDSISVSIDIAGLTYGNYSEALIFSSPEAANSPETARVHLELVGNMPYLSANPDSVAIEGKQDELLSGAIQILNLGDGALDWKASVADNWISLQNPAGSDNEILNFSLETSSLPAGYYYSEITISDSSSFNQSIEVPITLHLIPSDTIIPPTQPDTVYFGEDSVNSGGEAIIPLSVTLTGPRKGGYIPLSSGADANLDSIKADYSAMPSFVEFFGGSGQRGTAEFGFRISDSYLSDSTIPAGVYHIADLFLKAGVSPGNVRIDTTHSDTSQTYILNDSFEKNTPIVHSGGLVIEPPPPPIPDTVRFLSANTSPGSIGIVPIAIRLVEQCKGGYIPFKYDTALSRLDSIVLNKDQFPSFVNYTASIIGNGEAEIGFRISESYYNDSLIPSGNFGIAELFFTAGMNAGIAAIDTSSSDSSSAYTIQSGMTKSTPIVRSGSLIINRTTSISQTETIKTLPEKISLQQNLPNPFNMSTDIEICLPRAMPVTVQIFNLLGQEICRLYEGTLPAGSSRLAWNGILNDSRPAPSGIYFYGLRAGETVLVRKMVLLK